MLIWKAVSPSCRKERHIRLTQRRQASREENSISPRSKGARAKGRGYNPPIPFDVELTPMKKAGLPDGNAELAVRYENAESLGESVVLDADKRKYVLKRDERDPSRFAGMIDFDFDLFQEEHRDPRAPLRRAMGALQSQRAGEGGTSVPSDQAAVRLRQDTLPRLGQERGVGADAVRAVESVDDAPAFVTGCG
jgi:hypothetical protein